MHCSSQAGHLSVVKLLVESGSPTTAETSNGRTPLWFAASENKLKVVTYLIQREHDSYKLLEDRKVLLSMENETFLVIFMHNDSDKAFMMLICFYITVCLQFDGLWQEVWQCTHGRFHFGLAGSSGCGGQNFCHFQRIVFQSKFNISTKASTPRPKVSKNSKYIFFYIF